MILINHTSAPVRKERLSPTSKARREASRNEFVEKSGMPDRVKSFREIDRENCPRAPPGFVKPIRNGLRKVQNLIKSRPSRAETWRGERMQLDSRKKNRRDRMMRSNSFDTQEVREIGRKEAVAVGVMTMEVSQNEEISGGGKKRGRKGVGSAIRWGGANRGAYTLRNDTEEELLREMLIPT